MKAITNLMSKVFAFKNQITVFLWSQERVYRELKKSKLLSTAVTLSVLMSTVAVSGAYAAEKMNQYNLSEVVVEAERGNLAGGMMQTR